MFGAKVEKVERVGSRFLIGLANGESVSADRLMIASGGEARATGGGYALAAMLGHTIVPLAPSLSSLIAKEPWVTAMAGVSFKSARLKIKGSEEYEFTGPFVFTHRGVTGPAVFALSALAAYEKLSAESPARLLIDLLPETREDALVQEVQKVIAAHPKKTFSTVLSQFVPRSVAEVACHTLGIIGGKLGSETPKKEIHKSVAWIKGVPLTIVGRTAGDEFVTAGGVSLKEVDSKTMQSKLCPGLFFGGEVLDVDGFTGGFNLQAAWATGRLAGENLAIVG